MRVDRAVLQVVDGPDDRDLPALDLCGDPAAALRHLLGDELGMFCSTDAGSSSAPDAPERCAASTAGAIASVSVAYSPGSAPPSTTSTAALHGSATPPRGRARTASGRRRRAQPRAGQRRRPRPGPATLPATPNDEEIAEALVKKMILGCGTRASADARQPPRRRPRRRGSRWRRLVGVHTGRLGLAAARSGRVSPHELAAKCGVGVGGRVCSAPGRLGRPPRRSLAQPSKVSRRPPRPDRRHRLGVGRRAAHRAVRPISDETIPRKRYREGGAGAVACDPAPESRRAAGFPGSGAQVRILPGAPMRCRENGAILPR